jgi:transcriptional antiterminator
LVVRLLPEDELRQLYVEEFYTITDLTFYYGCSQQTIQRNLKLHNIPLHKRGNFLHRRLRMSEQDFFNLLKELHVERNLSTYDIADYLEVSQRAVWNNLTRMNLIRRKR